VIVIIGAGPAGLAAAKAIGLSGGTAIILDASPRGGGQYWRHRDEVTGYKAERAEPYLQGLVEDPALEFISGASVWSAEPALDGYKINFLCKGEERSIIAEKLIIATGAYDRSLPYPGWNEVGAMTPGGAQALLKGHGVVAGKAAIVAGTGPFLLPVATALAKAGAQVKVYEAQSPMRWALSPVALALNPSKFFELVHYVRQLAKYRIPISFGRAVTSYQNGAAEISKVTQNLSKKSAPGLQVSCDLLAVGWGFTPDLSVGGALGCAQELAADETVVFAVDSNQRSSQKNIWIAGEATGIGGADLALAEGEIAGLAAMGRPIPLKLRFKKFSKSSFARALQRSYPIGKGWQDWLTPETLICRCEEVSCREVLESVSQLGADDVRTAKLFTRAGMGLCQGRICARAVSELIGGVTGAPVNSGERIAASNRPISAPITLGLLGDGAGR
jgi:D-hydroxyproline dehydrogenase subunit alpha